MSTPEEGYGSISSSSSEETTTTSDSSDLEGSPLIGNGNGNGNGIGGQIQKALLRLNGVRRVAILALLGVFVVLIGGGSLFQTGVQTGVRPAPFHNTKPSVRSSKPATIHDNGTSGSGASHSYSGDDGDPASSLPSSFAVSPVGDMGMLSLSRNDDALPSPTWGAHLDKKGHPLPTNSWYLNLVSHRAAYRPDDGTRVYTVPYIVDTASPFPGMEGLRVHWPVVKASDTNVQMVDDFKNSFCLGSEGFQKPGGDDDDGIDGTYNVKESKLSHLGVGLEWGNDGNGAAMSTDIVRGMPFATMAYSSSHTASQQPTVPTIYSYNGLASDIQIDRESPFEPETSDSPKLVCGKEGRIPDKGNTATVQSHLHLHFVNSDFTWLVVFSKPVRVSCASMNGEADPMLRDFKMTFAANDDGDDEDKDDDLVVRAALLNQCTTGHATVKEHCTERNKLGDPEGYEHLLKTNAHVVSRSPTLGFDYSSPENSVANITIDWDAVSTTKPCAEEKDEQLLVFAMPHHRELLSGDTSDGSVTDHCVHSFHGETCLVRANTWVLEEDTGSPLSFLAPRPPEAELIPTIAEYLADDIGFKIPENTLRGASDTYFSGKTLARLARILVIASELDSLASAKSAESIADQYFGSEAIDSGVLEEAIEAASGVDLPSRVEFDDALKQLRKSVQVWLKSDAEAPYLYDKSWGGLVNCGCTYVGKADKGVCNNTFPECPALLSVNEDFGNGYYNDHHYHYGYHVYAAAVVARFDPSWGRKHFDEVLLYIRDFANPHDDDEFFPQYRQKDWFLGSSWASGIVSAENSPHGRNEESSSEAISAYEGVALFGSAMVDAFEEVASGDDCDDSVAGKLETAKLIRDSGQLLTASEIHATNRYWHVWSSDTHNNSYPSAYAQPVVGMVYDTMATFQTWFAPWAVVSYGIQLIPLTPAAETRDDVGWATELYPLYDKACKEAGDFCEKNGWSILQAGLLATTGNHTDAVDQARAVPKEVFETEGGVGNSMSNTIW
eukprot:CAMPEP_0201142448 /NCGR_PEP_ID=MMETSP0851-20130426/4120_1 /ASSEMBLY_ACC=CAM_ASM_000631 /TAXON_ID=183588 /ORGANISM="Pseudo-nitzschia fraudulenta, Strain WWA7" /LENGTH=1007 /DNA_ID=CAMNT_0047416093 /DNA_START=86 /DNA_END=3106 /DNA_ORIENTATION=-